jgi:hypothetical protein
VLILDGINTVHTVGIMKELKGKRFGKLVVIKRAGKTAWGNWKWLCHCDCGAEKIIQSGALLSGHTVSCGQKGCKHHYEVRG